MFKTMDKMEVEINRIDHLKMVHIYEVTGANLLEATSGCTAIAIYYGEDGELNINDLDSHFDLLLGRVLDLYSRAENKALIMMDDSTRSFLDTGVRAREEKSLSAFYEMEPSDFPMIADDSALGGRFLSLVEYLLTGLYKTLDINMDIRKRRNGWRGAAVLWGFDGAQQRQMCVQTSELHDNHYVVTVSEFLRNHVPLRIEVITKKTELELFFSTPDEIFYGKGYYQFGAASMTQRFEAYYKGQAIFFDDRQTSECMIPPDDSLSEAETKLLMGTDSLRVIYRLPWGMKYILSESIDGTEETMLVRRAATYLYGDFMEQFGWSEVFHRETSTRMQSESFQLNRLKIAEGQYQTHFIPVKQNSTGNYKSKLANKYFIHE